MMLYKTKDQYLPGHWPVEVKKDTLHYFIYGKGWQKTKRFETIQDVELPEQWDTLTWLDIAKYYEQYGIEVANVYAKKKTAGIVSRQTAMGYGIIYSKIKDIIPPNFDVAFFECLSVDYMLSCFGTYIFDIVKTDKRLAEINPDYKNIPCEYRGEKNVSLQDFILKRYGQPYVNIIERLIKTI